MRADARKNYDHLLAVAREVITHDGADASLRDIARKAEVGLGTLYRHFPNREALLGVLLEASLDEVLQQGLTLEATLPPDEALVAWSRAAVTFTHNYRGAVDLMADAMDDPASALNASCARVKAMGARLLKRAQDAGLARTDIDGADLLTLIAALGWVNDQPSLAPRADRLFQVMASAVLSKAPASAVP